MPKKRLNGNLWKHDYTHVIWCLLCPIMITKSPRKTRKEMNALLERRDHGDTVAAELWSDQALSDFDRE